MNSRYGIYLLSMCWISLAGCANWQNRATTISGPGSAAGLSTSPAPLGSPMIQGPETPFGEPPPPVPPGPSDPSMNLAPLGSASPQKLNLASTEDNNAPSTGKMYNLDSSKKATSKVSVASSAKTVEKKSSTLSRLAGKADSGNKVEVSESKQSMSTISRLSKDASNEKESKATVSASAVAESDTESLPVPAQTKTSLAKPADEPTIILDTTLLAQPVRKGADSKSSNSDGPQSNVIRETNMFKTNKSPAIYPVSNPATGEPVNLIEFS